MEDCKFCDIIHAKSPGYRIYEDPKHLAILDVFPNTKGQTLIITKEHLSSDFLSISNHVFTELMLTTKEVAMIIKDRLLALRIFIVLEGMEINHLHVKLYPIYKAERNTASPLIDNVYFDKYKGYLTTVHGPKAKHEDLKELRRRILDVHD